jgi:hypothetical protein
MFIGVASVSWAAPHGGGVDSSATNPTPSGSSQSQPRAEAPAQPAETPLSATEKAKKSVEGALEAAGEDLEGSLG